MNELSKTPDPAQAEAVNRMDEQSPAATHKANRKRGFLLLAGVVVLGLAGWGLYDLVFASPHQETDDAYVAGNVVAITARDPGTVVAIHADTTQSVKAGDPLVDFDPSLVTAQMASAEAKLATAVRNVRGGLTRVDTADAAIVKAQTALATARADLSRRQAAAGAVSGEEVAHAADAVRNASAALDLARSQRAEAASAVAGTDLATNPEVLAAIAEMKRMAIAQSHVHITAPIDGVVAQRSVQLGQQVAAGVPLMTVVPLKAVWVDANFRETQLADLRIGQPATLHADAYGKDVLFHGHVVGLSPGSGSAFALLPPQNASGNWIKIVQRLAVRIELTPSELADHPLRVGLSVTVDVDTSHKDGASVAAQSAKPVGEQSVPDVTASVEPRIRQIITANRGQ